MNETGLARARRLGSLIQGARERANRGLEECANVLGLPTETLAQAETGDYNLSLPDLETLALHLGLPMAYFWGDQAGAEERPVDYALYRGLRQRVIGLLIRQARVQAQQSAQELADATGIDEDRIEAYEASTLPTPYLELESIAKSLQKPLDYFAGEEHGPLARRELGQKTQRRLGDLPPDLQAFVAEPINRSYLETAKRLSELDVNRLRGIAEGILEITY
ncbi:MAG: helix-turn-helix domain-containing protein [Candidatus Promineifilaceae bacterium]